ncbi:MULTISPECIES: hypothetical protein [Hyphomicrobiales]|jgi:hypothetical protein|uniref:hypothetical protein n=1 Tax=Methylobacterium sp. CCH7-A2 TaxID=1768789 RepID=UPI00082E676E|nr:MULTISPECIES: hypothetical protein [Hyphomicrobiales]
MAETVRDFLVGIGYKIDGNSEQRFRNSVESATKAVVGLGVAVAAVTTAVTAAVTKIAAGFDDLYYASQRTKASAENIKSVGYAVSQLGGSYQGAVASIEAFALKMRSNPGYEGMAKSLGVVTRENGRLKDTTVLMTDLARALSRKPEYVRLQYLEALGIDEATYKALASGDLVRFTEEYRRKQEALGVSQTRAAEIGKDLTNAWRSLGATAAAVGDKLLQSLGPGIKDFVDRIDAFLVRNADKIVAFFEKAAEWVGKLLNAFIQLVEKGEGPLVEFFDKMVKGVEKMQTAFAALAAFLGGAFLLSVLGSFAKVGSGFAAMLLKLGIPAAALGIGATAMGYGPGAEALRQNGVGSDPDVRQATGAARYAREGWNWVKRKLGFGDSAQADPAALSRRSAGGGARNNRLTPDQAAEMARGIQAAAKSIGISPDDLATAISYETGGTMDPWQKGPRTQWGRHRGLIQWGEPQARKYGVDANTSITDQLMAAARYLRDRGVKPGDGLLQVYAAINAGHASKINATDAHNGGAPGTVADKVATMGRHKGALSRLERQGGVQPPAPPVATPAANDDLAAEYKRKSGRDLASDREKYPDHVGQWVEQFTGKKMPEQPKPFDMSRFNAVNPARVQANAALVGGFGLGGITALTPPPASNTNVDMNQRTEITILGGSDPQATAREVAGAQERVNGGLIRNVQGAVR